MSGNGRFVILGSIYGTGNSQLTKYTGICGIRIKDAFKMADVL
jgi:hypothetical protein